MPPDPGEPNEKITLNVYRRDMELLRQRYPRGGHLVFIKRLLRAWAELQRTGIYKEQASELVIIDEASDVSDEAWETLKTLERKFP